MAQYILRILTHNAIELNSPHKCSLLLRTLKHHNPDIVLLQETHWLASKPAKFSSKSYTHIEYAPFTKKARGTAILLHKLITFESIQVIKDPQSRYVILICNYDVWRAVHPEDKDYTHFSHPHKQYARLDYIFSTADSLDLITKANISLCAWSDHDDVLAYICSANTVHIRAPWRMPHHLLGNVHFSASTSHEDISFTDYGDVPGHYDIINWIPSDIPGKLDPNKVGSFNSLAPKGKQFIVNDSAIIWSPKLKTMPTSVCNDICAHGYRKVPWKEYPACCYGCVPCAEGEISKTTDAETCITCPEDQWPNDKRTICIRKTVEFLSFEETLGIVFTSISIFCCIVTITILVIFIKHRTTPVVKANNQNLSYTLLLSLMLSFLCSLLFIGRPVQVSCLLRQSAFGIIFTVSVSSVLAKSVTVVIAFNATKPDSKIKKWVGSRVSIRLVLVCSLGQTVICTLWLALYPPYPNYDTQSYIGTIILQCNEGSITAFYLVIGYIGFLSTVSFIVAFMVRKLPASFNEAQMITFSMLVFCSVWISFIPAYLSTKGKYVVAVEIFAILASSAGLLGCIFIPKCYIILFKPELNTRVHIISKH
ncbi:vomeronasal type-2 receptor 26-like [Bombina bombina]|uniref:vomeronasal type-2 receptor 26-like n=1 Tax=Bombina bombina TaxID=8345 RepID=UPI00235B1162|nr:vomeronasal type-2 receptor 26-like [Bombina bombina]